MAILGFRPNSLSTCKQVHGEQGEESLPFNKNLGQTLAQGGWRSTRQVGLFIIILVLQVFLIIILAVGVKLDHSFNFNHGCQNLPDNK